MSPRADFEEEHIVVLDRTEEDGTQVLHDIKIRIPRKIVEDAERGNKAEQHQVIEYFKVAFGRKPWSIKMPEDLLWEHFRHPILPTVQATP